MKKDKCDRGGCKDRGSGKGKRGCKDKKGK